MLGRCFLGVKVLAMVYRPEWYEKHKTLKYLYPIGFQKKRVEIFIIKAQMVLKKDNNINPTLV
jgi:hypothetical protein